MHGVRRISEHARICACVNGVRMLLHGIASVRVCRGCSLRFTMDVRTEGKCAMGRIPESRRYFASDLVTRLAARSAGVTCVDECCGGVSGARLKHNPAKRALGRVEWLCVSCSERAGAPTVEQFAEVCAIDSAVIIDVARTSRRPSRARPPSVEEDAEVRGCVGQHRLARHCDLGPRPGRGRFRESRASDPQPSSRLMPTLV